MSAVLHTHPCVLVLGWHHARCSACGRNAALGEPAHVAAPTALVGDVRIGCGRPYAAVACADDESVHPAFRLASTLHLPYVGRRPWPEVPMRQDHQPGRGPVRGLVMAALVSLAVCTAIGLISMLATAVR